MRLAPGLPFGKGGRARLARHVISESTPEQLYLLGNSRIAVLFPAHRLDARMRERKSVLERCSAAEWASWVARRAYVAGISSLVQRTAYS